MTKRLEHVRGKMVAVSLNQMRALVVLSIVFFAASATYSQSCPKSDARAPGEAQGASALHGTLTYHDELRQWLGIKLDSPACGETEIQLVFSNAAAWRRARSLQQCKMTVRGKLYESPTGYYSAHLAISNPELKPDPSCRPFPIKPDPTTAPIPTDLEIFHASITVDYRDKGHVDVNIWKDESKHVPLAPWQAFIHYFLTGAEDVMWFGCRQGFQIKEIAQDPESPTGIFQDEPDLNSAVFQSTDAPNTITFTCERKATHSKTGGKGKGAPTKQ